MLNNEFYRTKSRNTKWNTGSSINFYKGGTVSISNSKFYSASHYAIYLENIDNVKLSEIYIDGENFQDSTYCNCSAGIMVYSCANIAIDKVEVKNTVSPSA